MATVDYLIIWLLIVVTTYAIWKRTYYYNEFMREREKRKRDFLN